MCVCLEWWRHVVWHAVLRQLTGQLQLGFSLVFCILELSMPCCAGIVSRDISAHVELVPSYLLMREKMSTFALMLEHCLVVSVIKTQRMFLLLR